MKDATDMRRLPTSRTARKAEAATLWASGHPLPAPDLYQDFLYI